MRQAALIQYIKKARPLRTVRRLDPAAPPEVRAVTTRHVVQNGRMDSSNPSSSSGSFTPYVPETSTLPELTFRAVFLGTAMAIVLGTANAYLGMRAG